MPELDLSQGTIYYEIHGEGEPLVGLHYGAGSTKAWKNQISAFAEHFTFVIYDRLGHGQSEHHLPYEERYFENRAMELGELITHLGLDSVHLCGMCEGGAVAFVFASSWPEKVKTLILQGVGYYGTDQTIAQCEQYFQPWPDLDISIRHRLIHYHGEDYAMLKWESLRAAKYYVWSRSYDLRPRFFKIAAPTMIIGGDRDPFFGLEQPIAAYRGIKNAELCIMPGTGHFANEEAPAMFNQIVLDFLKKHICAPNRRNII
ncbi:MAG: alpha/beta hydrolase [Deltaproteobacteria bacterium]|nr:alpha/beta hydrolase [Deltaproteobacteria bacterium]